MYFPRRSVDFAAGSKTVRRWKISGIDLRAREKWFNYSRAKDDRLKFTDIKQAPWWVVNSNDKRRARLNVIGHVLETIPYEQVEFLQGSLGKPLSDAGYVRQPMEDQNFVPEVY